MTEKEAINLINLTMPKGNSSMDIQLRNALEMATKALEVVNNIVDLIKIEQQPTSCEHTKLISFVMIEKVITDYQLSN